MDESFSEASRQAIELSRYEAARLGHDYIGTEHLLLGLIRQKNNRAVQILEDYEIKPDELKRTIEGLVLPAPASTITINQLPLTTNAKRVFEISGQEARALRNKSINSEHFLLAILKKEDCIAAQALSMYHFTYGDAYKAIAGISDPRNMERIEFPISEGIRDVLQSAQSETQRLRNHQTTLYHLLLGMLCLKEDPIVKKLATVGLDLDKLKSAVEWAVSPNPRDQLRIDLEKLKITIRRPANPESAPPLSDGASYTIVTAYTIARERGLQAIDTTCLLLAILKQSWCLPAQVLSKDGLRYEQALAQLKQTL